MINTKEQIVINSIKDAFEDMQTPYSLLGYKIDLYFQIQTCNWSWLILACWQKYK